MKASNGYTNSRERYDDFRSSANIFIFFGVIGLIYTALCITGHVGKFRFFNNTFQYIIATVMFGSFLIIGIITHFQAKKISSDIKTEDEALEIINEYLTKHLTSDYVEENSTQESDVEKCFEIVEKMTSDIHYQFPEISEVLIESTVENYYNSNF